jgi:hypothetical protein
VHTHTARVRREKAGPSRGKGLEYKKRTLHGASVDLGIGDAPRALVKGVGLFVPGLGGARRGVACARRDVPPSGVRTSAPLHAMYGAFQSYASSAAPRSSGTPGKKPRGTVCFYGLSQQAPPQVKELTDLPRPACPFILFHRP